MIVPRASDPLERFLPPHRRDGGDGNGKAPAVTLADVDSALARTRSVLEHSLVGDLLAVTSGSADGSDQLASGRAPLVERWFVVRGVGTSAGGRNMIEGELDGKRAQILDQGGANQARIGISGPLLDERSRLANARGVRDAPGMKRAANAYARKVEREADKATLVSQLTTALTMEMLEDAVKTAPAFWTRGDGAHSRRVVRDPTLEATKTAGELLALKHGNRDIVLVQLTSDWDCGLQDSIRAPYAAALLEDMLSSSDSFAVTLSEARYAERGDEDEETTTEKFQSGITAVVYRDTAEAKAQLLASMGVQASRPIAGAFEQAVVGVALGYSDENIMYHIRQMNDEKSLPSEDIPALVANAKAEITNLGT